MSMSIFCCSFINLTEFAIDFMAESFVKSWDAWLVFMWDISYSKLLKICGKVFLWDSCLFCYPYSFKIILIFWQTLGGFLLMLQVRKTCFMKLEKLPPSSSKCLLPSRSWKHIHPEVENASLQMPEKLPPRIRQNLPPRSWNIFLLEDDKTSSRKLKYFFSEAEKLSFYKMVMFPLKKMEKLAPRRWNLQNLRLLLLLSWKNILPDAEIASA